MLLYQTNLGQFYCADARDCLEFLNESPKLIVTDPPYLIEYSQWERQGLAIEGDTSNNTEIIEIVLEYCKRLREDGALYCFCSWKTVDIWKREIEKVIPVKNIIVWEKDNWTMGNLYQQYAQCYELIIYAPKKDHRIKGRRDTDVWRFKRVPIPRIHPTQKPEALIEHILTKSSDPGDLVVDPFAGSGTLADVAERLGRRWFCVEINKEISMKAVKRLSQLSLKLF